MKPEQLFRRVRKLEELDSINIELGPNYIELANQYFLEEYVYPNEIFENIKEEYDFLYVYKSYHFGYFLMDGRFYSFSGLSSIKHVEFNGKNLVDKYKVAIIGSAYIPQMSLFIDVDKSGENFESVFVQPVSELDEDKGRIYVAGNRRQLIDKLTFYMVGAQENLSLI